MDFITPGPPWALIEKVNVLTRRWRERFPTPPSPSLPPLCSPLLRCRSLPALLQLALAHGFDLIATRIVPVEDHFVLSGASNAQAGAR